jgi:hypothetical protein
MSTTSGKSFVRTKRRSSVFTSTLTATSAKLHIKSLNGLGSSGSSESASIARSCYGLGHGFGLGKASLSDQALDRIDRITWGMS